jgi:hypothetical protein
MSDASRAYHVLSVLFLMSCTYPCLVQEQAAASISTRTCSDQSCLTSLEQPSAFGESSTTKALFDLPCRVLKRFERCCFQIFIMFSGSVLSSKILISDGRDMVEDPRPLSTATAQDICVEIGFNQSGSPPFPTSSSPLRFPLRLVALESWTRPPLPHAPIDGHAVTTRALDSHTERVSPRPSPPPQWPSRR